MSSLDNTFTARRRAQLLAEGRTPTVLTANEEAVEQESWHELLQALEVREKKWEEERTDGLYPFIVAKIRRQLERLS